MKSKFIEGEILNSYGFTMVIIWNNRKGSYVPSYQFSPMVTSCKTSGISWPKQWHHYSQVMEHFQHHVTLSCCPFMEYLVPLTITPWILQVKLNFVLCFDVSRKVIFFRLWVCFVFLLFCIFKSRSLT
jgi:hypothetical protein